MQYVAIDLHKKEKARKKGTGRIREKGKRGTGRIKDSK
jgi:hypothetical protein